MTHKKTLSFRVVLSILLLSLTLAVGLGSLFFLKNNQEKFLALNFQQQANAITTLVTEDIAKLIYLDDPDAAADIIQRLKRIPELHAAYFFDTEKSPILSIRSPHDDQTISGGSSIDSAIYYHDIELGQAHFIFYSPQFNAERDTSTRWFLGLLVALFILSFTFMYYVDRHFLSRLHELSQFLKNAAENKDFSSNLIIEKNDEIGIARQNFNALINIVKEKTDYLTFQANHDGLTGLYNRHYLLKEIQTTLDNKQLKHNCLCYIDLDQFKIVNDSCGHLAGDQLLIKLSENFKNFNQTYPNSVLGRISGDEFILLLPNNTPEEADKTVSALHQLIGELQFIFQERTFLISASIGIIHFQNQPINAEGLLSAANSACYKAKNEGRDKIVSYDIDNPKLQNEQCALNWVSRIYQALEQDEFELFLQPIVPAKSTQKVYQHFETLIRLKSNDQIISPGLFIPVADRYGLTKKIDLWVFKSLLRQLQNAPNFLASLNVITINLSVDSLMDQPLMHQIDAKIEAHKIPYEKLCFEITETGIIGNFEQVQEVIQHFSEKGVQFALDDFGSGMSSFGYLSKLPVTYLKIDGGFVKDIETNPVMKEMVVAMNRIGHLTDKKVIAEYVETAKAVSILQEIDVDYIQGYFFSKPKPINHFIALVDKAK